MLWVMAIRVHSPSTFSNPRNRNRSRPAAQGSGGGAGKTLIALPGGYDIGRGWACPGGAWEPYGVPHLSAMPDPSEELITILVEIHSGIRQARPSGRLRRLLVAARTRRDG